MAGYIAIVVISKTAVMERKTLTSDLRASVGAS